MDAGDDQPRGDLRLHPGLREWTNVQDLIELRNFQNFLNDGPNVFQSQLSADRRESLVKSEQVAQNRASQVFNVRQIDSDDLTRLIACDARQQLTNPIGTILIQIAAIHESNYQSIAFIGHSQSGFTRVGHFQIPCGPAQRGADCRRRARLRCGNYTNRMNTLLAELNSRARGYHF